MSESVYEVIDAQGAVVNNIILDNPATWLPPPGCSVRPYVAPTPQAPAAVAIVVLTQLAFLRRFTAAERIAARASSDPLIVDFLHLLDLAQDIRLDDPDTIAGVRYLETVGVLAAGRADVILTPEEG